MTDPETRVANSKLLGKKCRPLPEHCFLEESMPMHLGLLLISCGISEGPSDMALHQELFEKHPSAQAILRFSTRKISAFVRASKGLQA